MNATKLTDAEIIDAMNDCITDDMQDYFLTSTQGKLAEDPTYFGGWNADMMCAFMCIAAALKEQYGFTRRENSQVFERVKLFLLDCPLFDDQTMH